MSYCKFQTSQTDKPDLLASSDSSASSSLSTSSSCSSSSSMLSSGSSASSTSDLNTPTWILSSSTVFVPTSCFLSLLIRIIELLHITSYHCHHDFYHHHPDRSTVRHLWQKASMAGNVLQTPSKKHLIKCLYRDHLTTRHLHDPVPTISIFAWLFETSSFSE